MQQRWANSGKQTISAFERFQLEAFALIRNRYGQPILSFRHRYTDFLMRAVLVPVNYCVHHGFAHGHADFM